MAHLIEVAFRGNRKEFFRWSGDTPPALKAAVVVEADRGEDLGHVHSTGDLAEVRCKGCPHGCGTAVPARAALRLASLSDQLQASELKADNESARQRAMERVRVNGLVMKLTDAEWQWDRKKLTFYFTSDKRVDFRTLVRELASMFRTRIELKQIGVRDEAKRLSGIGRCGREYCSSSWLPDLRPVNLAVAKDQKLSLNPSQISGACGRLMCCLRYEHEFYVQSRRRFPKEGKILRTRLGEERVVTCNIFDETVALRSAEGDSRVVTLVELREELEALGMSLPADRITEHEPVYTAMEDSALSETQEFMVAREAMPMIDILELPTDDVLPGEASEIMTAVHVPVMPKRPVPSPESIPLVKPATPSLSHGEATVGSVTAASAPSASPTSASATSANSANDAAAKSELERHATPDVPADLLTSNEGEPRRKRRRGRRGGRRLRGGDGRHVASDEVSADNFTNSESDLPDVNEHDSDGASPRSGDTGSANDSAASE